MACHKDVAGGDEVSTVASTPPVALVAPVRTYAIHLGRPAHVGDHTHIIVDADYTEHTVATLAGQPPKDTSKQGHVHVEGQTLVEELQADGRTTSDIPK
jgi:hypothetical protein